MVFVNHHTRAQYQYIDTPEQLGGLMGAMEEADRIAIDTEADSLHHYYAKVCLIQLTFGNVNYILDPLVKLDFSQFIRVLADKPLLFHGADYDLRMMRSSFGFRPNREIFDTMIAAQLLGYSEFGLTALVQRFFQVDLANLGKKTDWSRRPLTPAQLQYACEDTHYLLPLANRLETELQEKGRREWHREACERVVLATALDKPRDLDKVWRIKGIRMFDRQQMAILREIWHWRENEAQQADLPPFKIMGNNKMLDLVMWGSAHPNSPLSNGPDLPRNCTGNRRYYLEKAIQKARNLPPSEWPHFPKQPRPIAQPPNCKAQIEALMNECAQIAGDLGIAPSVLATRAAITSIAHHCPQSVDEIVACSSMMRWQAKQMFSSIQRILHGERQLELAP